MSNELTVAQQTALASMQGMLGGLTKIAQKAPTGGGEYMKFGKDGKWSFGAASKNIDSENDIALVNVLSIKDGYVCWTDHDAKLKKKNTKMGEVMHPAGVDIDFNALEDHGWDWKPQQAVDVKFIEGAHVGSQTNYSTSSQGGLEAFGAMVTAVQARVAAGDTAFVFPLVAFDETSYDHPQWGKTYKPVIDIVGWADMDGNEEPDDGTEEEAPAIEEKPKAKATRKAAPKPKPAPEPAPEPEPEQEEPEQEQTEPETAPEPEAADGGATRTRRRRR